MCTRTPPFPVNPRKTIRPAAIVHLKEAVRAATESGLVRPACEAAPGPGVHSARVRGPEVQVSPVDAIDVDERDLTPVREPQPDVGSCR